MRKFQTFDSFGELNHGFHEGRSLLIHTKNEQIIFYDFISLEEITRVTFKQTIVRTLIPIMNEQASFRGIAVTEDQMAHLILLKQNQIEKAASIDLKQPLTLCFTMLLDASLHSYILFENGVSALITKKKTELAQSNWPPKTMIRVTHMEPYKQFHGEHLISHNSAGFLVYHYAGDTCQITSWIMLFPNRKIINGPFSMQVNPNSIFLSPYYFLHDRDIYSIETLKKIATLDKDAYCCSTYLGDSTILSDSEGQLIKIYDDKVEKFRELSSPPLRIEYNGEKYVYLTMNGLINDKLNIGVQLPLSSWASFFVYGGFPKVLPAPLTAKPESRITAVKIEETIVTSKSGGKWNPPHKIVSSDSIRVGQYDFFIAATAGTVHILKSHLKNPSILPVFECNWDTPISCVSLNSRLYAVASIDDPVKVQQYSGDEYSFTFESSLCISIALSETLLAAGFSGGSFLLISLKDKSQLVSIWPFRVPVKKVTCVDNDNFLVQWGSAIAKINSDLIQWIKFPSFPGAMTAAICRQGLISLATPTSVDVYSFADNALFAQIPQRAVGICINDRRTYILTLKNEIVVLYYHGSLKVDANFVIDVDNPFAILATDEILFVLCSKYISTFDKTGKKIENIELQLKPRFFDSASKGIYLIMYKSIWYIQNNCNIKKMPSDFINICGFSAIDDARYVIAANGRVYFVDHSTAKPVVSALSKFDKSLVGLKCYSSKIGGKNDSLFLLFNDHSFSNVKLPSVKSKT